MAVADALRLDEDGLRVGAGLWGGIVRVGRDAGVQVAAEQCGGESGLEPVGDRWGRAGCYGFLRGLSGAMGGLDVMPVRWRMSAAFLVSLIATIRSVQGSLAMGTYFRTQKGGFSNVIESG
ncbi:hypothetical protein [Streptomyces sp. NPDC096324]|uniref:hypothetical protein n=1 Tax=Streptomyces sp. NPDC096324 TaxID=3366085 RepID=UPI00380474F3